MTMMTTTTIRPALFLLANRQMRAGQLIVAYITLDSSITTYIVIMVPILRSSPKCIFSSLHVYLCLSLLGFLSFLGWFGLRVTKSPVYTNA